MREIEFRGKSKNSGRWVYGDLITQKYNLKPGIRIYEHNNKSQNDYQFVRIDEKTVGQYTGLKDKNGKKIFEGDIILCDNVQKVVVFFENGQFVVDHYAINLLCGRCNKSEVIGNIYDNQKLLKGE